MYFIVTPVCVEILGTNVSDQGASLAGAGFVDKSAFGREQRRPRPMSALGGKADIAFQLRRGSS
jgi:hypothetical protein